MMRNGASPALSALLDLAWRTVYRTGYPLARAWWTLTRPRHQGAVVAVYLGPRLLLVHSSYQTGWQLPGGGIHRDELPEQAAKRELAEELGLAVSALIAAGEADGYWDGRRDHVHFFELWLEEPPQIRLDNREIIAARFALPEEWRRMRLNGPIAAYLSGTMTHAAAGAAR